MKKLLSLFLSITVYLLGQGQPQVLIDKDDLHIGTNQLLGTYDNDQFNSVRLTTDSGYILAGMAGTTSSGTLSSVSTYGGRDGWVVKLNQNGSVKWQKLFGGTGADSLQSVRQTSDGGYILTGSTWSSNSGTLAGVTNYGSGDFWVIKLDLNGNIQWQKIMGSTSGDVARDIQQTVDGGYILIGSSTGSNSGTLTYTTHGSDDAWIIKLDGSGNRQWQRLIGGTYSDIPKSIQQTSDGGYVVAGYSYSASGTNADGWLFKLDGSGNMLWQKYTGGSGNDLLLSMSKTAEGGFIAAGSTDPLKNGTDDGWIVKLNSTGDVEWQQSFGGSGKDDANSVQQTADGGYIVGGSSSSSNSGTFAGVNTYGYNDGWLLKLNASGTMQWQQLLGGSNPDAFNCVQQTAVGTYVMVGSSGSSYSGTLGRVQNNGSLDGWVLEYSEKERVNTIKGTFFIDENFNGVKDAGEDLYMGTDAEVDVYGPGVVGLLPVTDGAISALVDTGAFKANILTHANVYIPVPSYHAVSFRYYQQVDSFSVALQLPRPDMQVSIIPVTPAKPGFTSTCRLIYKNVGNVSISSGYLELDNDQKVSLVSALPASSSADTLLWHFSNFNPGDTASVLLTFSVPPSVNSGDTLRYNAFPVVGDSLLTGRRTYLKQVVVSSFDPNDKTENNGGQVPQSFITDGSYLQYTVRFQNTGTGPATFVIVRDTLGSRVDARTLEMIAASHPYTLSVDNQNNLAFQFDNIQLPPSSVDEPNSHGYVTYRVRPQSDVAAGEVIHNTASIYFDYNTPVMTNDATTLVQGSITTLPQTLLHFSAAREKKVVSLNWKVTTGTDIRQYVVERGTGGVSFTSVGSRSAEGGTNEFSFSDPVSAYSGQSLYYRLKLVGADGRYTYSSVLRLAGSENSKNLDVYPNPVTEYSFVSFTAVQSGKAVLQVLSASGSVLKQEQVPVAAGRNTFPIVSRETIPAGLYFIRIMVNGEVISKAFTVQ